MHDFLEMRVTFCAPQTTSYRKEVGNTMTVERWEKFGFLAGPAFVISLIVSVLLPGEPPDVRASGPEIVQFFTDKATHLQVAAVISAASLVFALWWAASLWRSMTKAEYGKPHLALISALGFLFGGVMVGIANIVWTAGTLTGAELTPAIAKYAYVLSYISVGAAAFGFASSTAAASLLVLRRKFMPRWTAYLGGLATVLWLGGGVTVGSTARWLNIVLLAAVISWLIWIVAISVVLFRSPEDVLDARTTEDFLGVERSPIRVRPVVTHSAN